jgi:hypothetical protein
MLIATGFSPPTCAQSPRSSSLTAGAAAAAAAAAVLLAVASPSLATSGGGYAYFDSLSDVGRKYALICIF